MSIRNHYNVSQKPFGTILGLGQATINSYERGDVPTAAHSALIRQAGDRAALSRLTHELPAWQKTSHAKEISYAWALQEPWPE